MINKEYMHHKDFKLIENLDIEPPEIINLRSIYETKLKEILCLKEKLDTLEIRRSYSQQFNKLPSTVEWEILKKLEFKDYLNLALTCRKWYNTAASAPKSVKPNLKFECFSVNKRGFSLKYPYYVRHLLGLSLLNRIESEGIIGLSGQSQLEFLRLISDNRSRFLCKSICIYTPITCENTASLIYSMADMSSNLTFIRDEHVLEENEKCVFKERTLLERHLSHKECRISHCIDSTIPNFIIKQWIKGERPNLQFASVFFSESVLFGLDDVIEGLDEFVVDKQEDPDDKKHSFTVVVDGLPNIYVYCSWISVKMSRENNENVR